MIVLVDWARLSYGPSQAILTLMRSRPIVQPISKAISDFSYHSLKALDVLVGLTALPTNCGLLLSVPLPTPLTVGELEVRVQTGHGTSVLYVVLLSLGIIKLVLALLVVTGAKFMIAADGCRGPGMQSH